MIQEDNWFDEFYAFQDQKAQIFMGLDEEGLYYAITVFDEEKTYFQEKQRDLLRACTRINELFLGWTFSGATVTKSGCGSCAAH